jgi:hypothetical protein
MVVKGRAPGQPVASAASSAQLDRPAGRLIGAALLGVLIAAPFWVLAPELRAFALLGDDFAYIEDARVWSVTWRRLLEPHNTHVVPSFRLWTFALVSAAGRLANYQRVFAAGSYLGLVAAMIAVGWLTALETRQAVVSRAAMAVLGISTVSHVAVKWYSAGQALWAGTGVVATLLLARAWAIKGGRRRLFLAALMAGAAPAFWTAGLVSGPAAIAYLRAKVGSRARGPAIALAATTIGFLVLLLVLARRRISEPAIVWEQHPELWPRPVQAVLHTAQAIIEGLVLGNLGLDVVTTPYQAVALLAGLAAIWAWSHRGRGGASPLEAAGAVTAVGSLLVVFGFRGNIPYGSLRELTWYPLVAQVGAVLFTAGWWSTLQPAAPSRLTLRQAIGVLCLVLLLCMVHVPRAEQMLIAGAPPMTQVEARRFRTPEQRWRRALHFKLERHDRQFRALERLDRLDSLARHIRIDSTALRREFGRVVIPGIPEKQTGSDAFDLLTPLAPGVEALPDPGPYRARIEELLRPEPEARPPWLDPAKPWPPKHARARGAHPVDSVCLPG